MLPNPSAPGGITRCYLATCTPGAGVYDQALDTEEGDAAAAAGDPRYAKITEDEIRRATASGAHGGGSTEYDSAPLDAPPSADRGLQPAVLEAGYGGPDSIMNTAGAQWGDAAASSNARSGKGKGTGTSKVKGSGIKRSARQGSILAGFGDAGGDAEA